MADHVVEQGEHLTRIARRYGFANYMTVWDDAANDGLRETRPNPNVLFPGDVVVIPDREERTEDGGTMERHRFQADPTRLMLRLRLIDYHRDPLTETECRVDVEGNSETLVTDEEGQIEKSIGHSDEIARLTTESAQFSMRIGHLDPVQEDSGAEARLNNLGYSVPPEDVRDEDELRSAIEEFQCDHDMTLTGENDSETQSRLIDEHGS